MTQEHKYEECIKVSSSEYTTNLVIIRMNNLKGYIKPDHITGREKQVLRYESSVENFFVLLRGFRRLEKFYMFNLNKQTFFPLDPLLNKELLQISKRT